MIGMAGRAFLSSGTLESGFDVLLFLDFSFLSPPPPDLRSIVYLLFLFAVLVAFPGNVIPPPAQKMRDENDRMEWDNC